MGTVLHLLPRSFDPSPLVARVSHLRLRGKLLESERGVPHDDLLAYGSTAISRSQAIQHIASWPQFIQIYEQPGGDTFYTKGLLFFRQPNGPWYAEAHIARTSFSFHVWSNAGRSVGYQNSQCDVGRGEPLVTARVWRSRGQSHSLCHAV
jgi:hypothetical protein